MRKRLMVLVSVGNAGFQHSGAALREAIEGAGEGSTRCAAASDARGVKTWVGLPAPLPLPIFFRNHRCGCL